MKTRVIAVMSAAIIGGTALAAAAQTPAPPDPVKVAAGLTIYTTQKCAQCHQINKVGGKLAAALDGVGTRLKAADIKKWLVAPAELEAKLPKKPMVTMSGWLKTHKLTVADVDALVAYMLSLK